MVILGMIFGILIVITLSVLPCCLKAATEADKCMDRLLQDTGIPESGKVAEKLSENKGDCQ